MFIDQNRAHQFFEHSIFCEDFGFFVLNLFSYPFTGHAPNPCCRGTFDFVFQLVIDRSFDAI